MPNLRVCFLPELVVDAELATSQAVVVDVLRATTTVVHALAAGARAVVPCLTIEDARVRAAEFPQGEALLGGERGGLAIEGFDLGNSPAEYTASVVSGRTVVLTTTNGTRALLRAKQAARVWIGGFANLSAVCDMLCREQADAAIVCAGTDGHVTREDVLFAGAVADRLADRGSWRLDDAAQIARDAWRSVVGEMTGEMTGEELRARLVEALKTSHGGRNLIEIGLASDIGLAAQIDRHAIAPRYDARTGLIGQSPLS